MTPDELAVIHAASFTMPRPWSRDEFANILAMPNTHLLHKPNGFAIIRIAGLEAELLTISVDPAHRRQRIAHRLMETSIAHAEANNVQEIFLEVAETNLAAINLYQTNGFSTRATRKDYYTGLDGQKISAIVMARVL